MAILVPRIICRLLLVFWSELASQALVET